MKIACGDLGVLWIIMKSMESTGDPFDKFHVTMNLDNIKIPMVPFLDVERKPANIVNLLSEIEEIASRHMVSGEPGCDGISSSELSMKDIGGFMKEIIEFRKRNKGAFDAEEVRLARVDKLRAKTVDVELRPVSSEAVSDMNEKWASTLGAYGLICESPNG